MAYTEEQKNAVKAAIENYSDSFLDRYTQDDVWKEAKKALDANDHKLVVAAKVYDYIYDNLKADINTATALQQCIPPDNMILMRHAILKALEE